MKRLFLLVVLVCLSVFVVGECGDLICDVDENETSCAVDCDVGDVVNVSEEVVVDAGVNGDVAGEFVVAGEEEVVNESVVSPDEVIPSSESVVSSGGGDGGFNWVLWGSILLVILIMLIGLIWWLMRSKGKDADTGMMPVVAPVDSGSPSSGSPNTDIPEATVPAPVTTEVAQTPVVTAVGNTAPSAQPVVANPVVAS